MSAAHISSTAVTIDSRGTPRNVSSSSSAWVVRITSSIIRIAMVCSACCSRALRVLRDARAAGA